MVVGGLYVPECVGEEGGHPATECLLGHVVALRRVAGEVEAEVPHELRVGPQR